MKRSGNWWFHLDFAIDGDLIVDDEIVFPGLGGFTKEDMVSPVMGKCCRRKSFLGDDGHKRRIAVGFTREKI